MEIINLVLLRQVIAVAFVKDDSVRIAVSIGVVHNIANHVNMIGGLDFDIAIVARREIHVAVGYVKPLHGPVRAVADAYAGIPTTLNHRLAFVLSHHGDGRAACPIGSSRVAIDIQKPGG